MDDFLQRLRERKLVQWALAYLAGAFALIQVLDIVGQQFGWPDGVRRGITVALGIGFFVTLVLAWYHGERGAQRVTGTELLLLALLLAIGGGLLWRLAPGSREAPSDGGHVAASAAIPAKSIAVLPFDNLSHDPDNAYFAEGIQDEILTRLAKIGDLKVISRTSTAKYKSAPDNLREIANQLGVANILEGSVQKSNDQVRVNVQLINALSDGHLWADIYDRKLTDIFVVESDIAKTIADTLQAKLTGSERTAIAVRPTDNPEAYQLYLKGRFFWNKRTGPDLHRAVEWFDRAIEKDPNYAQAYAALAQAWMLLPAYNGGSPQECFPHVEPAARKALALDETSADAHTALAAVISIYGYDFPASIPEYERAIALDPNNATAHHWLGDDTLSALGQNERELAEVKRAQELDPLSLIINSNVGVAYMRLHRLEEAVAQLRRTLEMDENFYYAHYNLGLALEVQGKTAEAIAEYQRTATLTDDPMALGGLGHIYGTSGRSNDARKILADLRHAREQHYVDGYWLAIVALGLGDRSQAMDWLEQAYKDRAGFTISLIRIDPLLAPLRGDARFEALAEKIIPARDFGSAPK